MEETGFRPLQSHVRRIRDLVAAGKYRDENEFVRMAVELLLDWEGDHPRDCIDRINSMRPFTPQQEEFMSEMMKDEELKKQFGELERDKEMKEGALQAELSKSGDNHLLLRRGLDATEGYVRGLGAVVPPGQIPYGGYPRLSSFYSRLLPAKISVSVLAYRLAEEGKDRLELNVLRAHAYDIAEEIAEALAGIEAKKSTPRNRKMSTGLPKKGAAERDAEKIATAQKRFKDQFVGKVRKSRATGNDHFDGAPSALGLICAFEDGGKTFVSLTGLGKRFSLMRNPVIDGDYENKSFTRQESEFVLKELIPRLDLEKRLVDAAMRVINGIVDGGAAGKDGEKVSHMLNEEMRKARAEYDAARSGGPAGRWAGRLDLEGDASGRKVNQWRLATMGRLAELGVVTWTINEKGDSVYSPAGA